jgi:hypothetical protein
VQTIIKRLIISFVLLDNLINNTVKTILFRTRWKRVGKCRQCGNCCREILLKIDPKQLGSRWFTNLAIRWISWLFDFVLIRIDYTYHYLVFTCRQRRPDGRCGNYFWRPSVCRNYPLVDYFKKPVFLPGCGYDTVW